MSVKTSKGKQRERETWMGAEVSVESSCGGEGNGEMRVEEMEERECKSG